MVGMRTAVQLQARPRNVHPIISMGDLQDPIDGGTLVLVPYVWPYELWGYSLKFRPYIGLIYGRYLQSIGS